MRYIDGGKVSIEVNMEIMERGGSWDPPWREEVHGILHSARYSYCNIDGN